jgi:hypothetical protein
MPRDHTPATRIVTRRQSAAERRLARMAVARTQPQHPTHAYASARRAEFFSTLNRMRVIRKHGPKPFEAKLRADDEATLRAANRLAPVCLP